VSEVRPSVIVLNILMVKAAMLSAAVLNVLMVTAIILYIIILSDVVLIIFMLNVGMLSVVAPLKFIAFRSYLTMSSNLSGLNASLNIFTTTTYGCKKLANRVTAVS